MTVKKTVSSSSEQNQAVILNELFPLLADKPSVLEIASGTGQHAVHFANAMPNTQWQTSDLEDSHETIKQWITESQLTNVLGPMRLDVSKDSWPNQTYDALYTANSFHIMSLQNVTDFFAHISSVLKPTGLVIVYGPFNYQGKFTSESNQNFNYWLTSKDKKSGIKDFEFCNHLAEEAGLNLYKDIEMPHNNRILVWIKQP